MELKKAIKILKQNKKMLDEFYIISKNSEAIETVLKALEEKDKEIDRIRNIAVREIILRDKMIDEMAHDVLACGFDFINFGVVSGNFKLDKEKVKEYYRKKVENE